VQEVYLNDIVKIFLIENLLNPEYLSIILEIIKKIMKHGNDTFQDKIYTFMMNQKLFF